MQVDMKKVVFTGDSLLDNIWQAEDAGLDLNFTRWTDMVAKELEFEYVNTAVAGDTIKNICNNVESRVTSYKPTHVILDGGVNDIHQGVAKTAKEVAGNLEFLDVVLFESGCKMIYIFFPVDFTGVGDGQVNNTTYSELRRTLKEMFERYGTRFIDLSTTLGSIGNVKSKAYFYDKVHQNQYGQMLIAQRVSEELRNWFGIK